MKSIKEMIPWKKKKETLPQSPENTFQNMPRPLDDFFDHFFDKGWPSPSRFFGESDYFPKLDVKEERKKIIVEAEIPGVESKDIDISLDGRMLTIKGQKQKEKKDERKGYCYYERSFGSYNRTIRLPGEVDESKVNATYKRGVLKIELKKAKESETKKIEVKTTVH